MAVSNTRALHAAWEGGELVLWGFDGRRPLAPADLERAAQQALRIWQVAGGRRAELVMHLPGGSVRASVLRFPAHLAAEILVSSWPQRSWSASVRWFHAAAALAAQAVATGRVLPALETRGLRWFASWELVDDDEIDAGVSGLVATMPAAVGACEPATSPDDRVRSIVHALAAGTARFALLTSGWHPSIAPTRSPGATVLRRVIDALGRGGSPSETNARQEGVYLALAAALTDVRADLEGAVPVDVRARLHPPDDPDGLWSLRFEVAARHDPSLVAEAAWIWAGDERAAPVVGGGAGLASARKRLHSAINRLADRVPALRPLHEVDQPADLPLDLVGAAAVLGSLDECERAGVPVLVPAGLVRRRAKVRARATPAEGGGVDAGLGQALVDVDWKLALGDVELTDDELASLAAAKAPLVNVRGQWVRLDVDQLRAALANLQKNQRQRASLSVAEVLRTALELHDTDDELDASGWLGDLLDRLPDERLAEVVEPAGFVGELRHYQRRALGWLAFLGRLGLGGCLADDMGLGKTPTTLAHLLTRCSTRPSLVICPLSVVRNWESEAARFAPGLRVLVVHGIDRLRGEELGAAVRSHDLIITTFGTLTRDLVDLATIEWEVVVVDEAQAIKNHHTGAARAVRKLPARQKVALTGTPVENRLVELWAILDAVNPGMLGGVAWFKDRFATPIERHDDQRALEGLRRLTQPFVLRRTKADRALVPDLPDKVESIAWATLTKEQASLYKAVVDQFLGEVEGSEGMQRRGLVLATLTRLKQICNHPAHYLGDGTARSSRAGRSGLGGRSGKLERFDELLVELLDAGERALVFTQYREMGDLLVAHLSEHHHLEVPFLHGGVPKARRDRMVEQFQTGRGGPVQIVSLKAGGTGLNLTAASRVIHYDRWWNPAVEDQATDRAWRLGQTNTVFVHKLVCQGTLEERIDALISQKKALANLVVGTGEGWLTELSSDQLRALLVLDESAVGVR